MQPLCVDYNSRSHFFISYVLETINNVLILKDYMNWLNPHNPLQVSSKWLANNIPLKFIHIFQGDFQQYLLATGIWKMHF